MEKRINERISYIETSLKRIDESSILATDDQLFFGFVFSLALLILTPIFGVGYLFKRFYEHYFFKKYTHMGYVQEVFRVYNTFSLFLEELKKTKDKESFVKKAQLEERWNYLFHRHFYNLDPEIYSKWIDVKNNLKTKNFDSYYKKLIEAVNIKHQKKIHEDYNGLRYSSR